MEIATTIIAVLYAGTGAVSVIGYLPTLRDLTRNVASANILSYLIWTGTSGIGLLYALFDVADTLLVVITSLNFLLCAAVLALAVRVRIRGGRDGHRPGAL